MISLVYGADVMYSVKFRYNGKDVFLTLESYGQASELVLSFRNSFHHAETYFNTGVLSWVPRGEVINEKPIDTNIIDRYACCIL